MSIRILCFTLLCFISTACFSSVAKYSFDVDYQEMNITGENIQVMAINNQIPAPTIEAMIGDSLQVTFNNHMDVETSIHWHGVLLPYDQDGVPYLNTLPIQPNESFTYEFEIKHSGTYWYHSHTELQEQRGIYGALIFKDKQPRYEYDLKKVLVLSDWINENPKDVMRNLKRNDHYYAFKKDTVQSWQEVLNNGQIAIQNRINGALSRMGPMDISDVGYDAFLVNGKDSSWMSDVKPGDTVRLRIINAAASSYFHLNYSGGNMTIVEMDGMPIEPYQVDKLQIAIAETYDVMITLPEGPGAFEFRATSEDVTGYASVYLGSGDITNVKDLSKPDLYLVDHSMHDKPQVMSAIETQPMDPNMDHSQHLMRQSNSELIEYYGLRSITPFEPEDNKSIREIELKLTGSMERYVWSLNDLILSESEKIMIKKGERIRLKLVNTTMMKHPIHFHGHFFRVDNGQGNYSPLKHTVNVPQMQTVEIEFDANDERDWFLHCHNLYHMKSGMAAVISYDNSDINSSSVGFKQLLESQHLPWFAFANIGLQSNMVSSELWAMNARNNFNLEFDYNFHNEFEIDIDYERRLTRFFGLFLGVNVEGDEVQDRAKGIAGINYVLPFLMESNIRVDTDGEIRLQLQNDHQLTKRIHFDWYWNTDEEYRVRLGYEFNKQFTGLVNYDSDFKLGAGLELLF